MREEPVEFSSGGATLRGILHRPTDQKSPVPGFFCIHGLTLTHDMFATLAQRSAEAGVACLRFHMRGHGDSGGVLSEQGFEEQVADAAAALDFLSSQPGIDPQRLGVLGFSLGGAAAAVLSARKPFKALATWGSLLDTKNWIDSRFDQYGDPKNGLIEIWDKIAVSERLFTEAVANDPFGDALKFKGPYFAAHGGRDRNHPQAKSIELVARRQECGLPAEGYFPETSGHKFQVPEDNAVLVEKTNHFFEASL